MSNKRVVETFIECSMSGRKKEMESQEIMLELKEK